MRVTRRVGGLLYSSRIERNQARGKVSGESERERTSAWPSRLEGDVRGALELAAEYIIFCPALATHDGMEEYEVQRNHSALVP